MAAGKDEGDRGESSDSLSSVGSDSDSDSSEAQQVEWLATARAKRSTAGNRMKSMLANEEPAADDSDLELLFAEDEDDVGFTDVEEDASDVQMDSSSDEEDQGDAGDELEGEKELEREARAKRTVQRKRKAQDVIPVKFRKKVRIEQPAASSQSPASSVPPRPRPKKKSERASWLPTAAEMPTRASERQTTRLSKEQLHQQMMERELKRKKQMEMLEKKAKRLEAMKKPPMTQAERLAEAAIVEKKNSKSLNRWEEAEKQREEERLRKIAALQSRELEGPVVTFWSGIQELEEGQMKHIGKMVSIEEKAPRKKRQSAASALSAQQAGHTPKTEPEPKPMPPEDPAVEKPIEDQKVPGASESAAPVPTEPPPPTSTEQAPPALSVPSSQPPQTGPPETTPQTPATAAPSPANAAPQPPATSLSPPRRQSTGGLAPPAPQPTSILPQGLIAPPQLAPPPERRTSTSGFLAAPVLMAPPGGQMPALGFPSPTARSHVLAAPNTTHGQAPPPPPPSPSAPSPAPQAPTLPTTLAVSRPTPEPSPTASVPLQQTQGKAPKKAPETPQEEPPEPPMEGKVTKSCIILQNFDDNAIKDRQVQTQILFGRKMNKLAKPAHPPHCVITNHPARYRDPKTGLPYYNSYAYREIRRLHRGDYKWSRLIGAWVGSGSFAAKGVPERFLGGPSSSGEVVEASAGGDKQAGTAGRGEGGGGNAPPAGGAAGTTTGSAAPAAPVAPVAPAAAPAAPAVAPAAAPAAAPTAPAVAPPVAPAAPAAAASGTEAGTKVAAAPS